MLKILHDTYGDFCFALVPKYIPWRNAKDAKQIWKYHLKADLKKTPFTVEERNKIKELREKGMRWTEMESHFEGRDQIRLRNEYRKIMRHEKIGQFIYQTNHKESQEEKEDKEDKEKENMQNIESKCSALDSQNFENTSTEKEIMTLSIFDEIENILFSNFDDNFFFSMKYF